MLQLIWYSYHLLLIIWAIATKSFNRVVHIKHYRLYSSKRTLWSRIELRKLKQYLIHWRFRFLELQGGHFGVFTGSESCGSPAPFLSHSNVTSSRPSPFWVIITWRHNAHPNLSNRRLGNLPSVTGPSLCTLYRRLGNVPWRHQILSFVHYTIAK